MAGSSYEYANALDIPSYFIFIVLLPMLAFPVILYLGMKLNGKKIWKDTLKEGGLVALPIMAGSLLLSLMLIRRFINETSVSADSTLFSWANFAWMEE